MNRIPLSRSLTVVINWLSTIRTDEMVGHNCNYGNYCKSSYSFSTWPRSSASFNSPISKRSILGKAKKSNFLKVKIGKVMRSIKVCWDRRVSSVRSWKKQVVNYGSIGRWQNKDSYGVVKWFISLTKGCKFIRSTIKRLLYDWNAQTTKKK